MSPVPRLAAATLALLALTACPRFHSGAIPDPPDGSTFLEVDGVRVRYLDVGEGPAVLLLHGFGASLDTWDPVIPELRKRHRVIAFDLKGFGWTSRPAGDYSPTAQARLALAVLDARGVGDVAVVGHSWGSSVALALTLEAPQRVRRIALYSAYTYDDQVPSFFRWSRTSGLGEALFALFYRERMEDKVPLAFYDQHKVTQAQIDRADGAVRRPGAVAAALAAARGQRFGAIERALRTVELPALVMWGREDRVTPVLYGERLARDLPRARLIVYPRCGHFPMVEATHASTRALAEFLAEDAP